MSGLRLSRTRPSPRSASGLRSTVCTASRVASRRPSLSARGPLSSSWRWPRDSRTSRPSRQVNSKSRLGKSIRRLAPPPGIRTRRQTPVSRSARRRLVRTELDRLATVTLLPRPLSRPPLVQRSRSRRSGSPLESRSLPKKEPAARSRAWAISRPVSDPDPALDRSRLTVPTEVGVATRNWPLAGPEVTRASSLHIEGSRLVPHQEGWALEALKYAGSYVPPTSLALSSLYRDPKATAKKDVPNRLFPPSPPLTE